MTTIISQNGASPDWWRGAVIYQVYPRSFQDTNSDGLGDINGVTRRLPYIASLGVDAVWLSPFVKSPQADMGYDVSDYCDVDPIFGTLDDFDRMVAKAHELGLKVMIDQVLSHSSDQHPWFKESRSSRDNSKADWYVWADPKPDGSAPNNWLSIFGGPAWEWDGIRKQYYMHNFLASQPDFNFHNKDVQDALLDTVRFWLERGVDGFRLDTVNFYFHDEMLRDNPALIPDPDATANDAPDVNPYGMQEHLYDKTQPENLAFLQRFRALLDEYGGRTSVGEVGDGTRGLRTVAQYTGGGDKLHMCYTFDLLGPTFTAEHIRRSVQAFEDQVKDGWICWAFSNHDVERHVSRFSVSDAAQDKVAKLAINILASLRGSICLYQGEELGLSEAQVAFEDLQDPYGIRFWPAFKGRDGCRTPMPWVGNKKNAGFSDAAKPWLPVPEEHYALASDRQSGVMSSPLEHYRAMLQFRRAYPALRDGDVRFIEGNSDLLAFAREKADQKLLFVFNLNDNPQEFVLSRDYVDAQPAEMPGSKAVLADGAVFLEGYSCYCAQFA